MKMRLKIIVWILIGFLCLLGVFIIPRIHQIPKERSMNVSNESEDLEQPSSSEQSIPHSLEENSVSSKVNSLSQKQDEKPSLNEISKASIAQTEVQGYMPIMERLKAFKQSSKEYKELMNQMRPLLHRSDELQSEGMDLSIRLHEAIQGIIEIPQLPPEEKQKEYEQLLDQMSLDKNQKNDMIQKYKKLLSEAKNRKEERELLTAYSQDLQTRLNQTTKESKLLQKQIDEIDDAINNLLRQNGLPITQEEINMAIEKDREYLKN